MKLFIILIMIVLWRNGECHIIIVAEMTRGFLLFIGYDFK